MAKADEMKKDFFSPVAPPAQGNGGRPIQRGAPQGTSYGPKKTTPIPKMRSMEPKGMSSSARLQRRQNRRQDDYAQDRAITGMKQAGQTGRVAMREAGANQRQRSSFVQALQEQQNKFDQQNRQQQNRFGQQNAQQQNRFGQESAMQQGRFGQQNQLEQTKQEEKRRQSALDYRLSGGDVAGTAAIANGMPDYRNIQPLETQNKVGTIRTYETDSGGQQRYDSRTGRDYYPFSPVPLGERLTPRQ